MQRVHSSPLACLQSFLSLACWKGYRCPLVSRSRPYSTLVHISSSSSSGKQQQQFNSFPIYSIRSTVDDAAATARPGAILADLATVAATAGKRPRVVCTGADVAESGRHSGQSTGHTSLRGHGHHHPQRLSTAKVRKTTSDLVFEDIPWVASACRHTAIDALLMRHIFRSAEDVVFVSIFSILPRQAVACSCAAEALKQ